MDPVFASLSKARQSDDDACAEATAEGVTIHHEAVALDGDLVVPEQPEGAVLIAHASSKARLDPTNRSVAKWLNDEAHSATLLFDLLSSEEDDLDARTGALRFDLPLLAARIHLATDWLASHAKTAGLSIGYFGVDTVTAAALIAAAEHPDDVASIVSHGGRPDLAGPLTLAKVRAPTLLIVGSRDRLVLDLNARARRHLRVRSDLEIILHGGHFIDEGGAWRDVADRASTWFRASYSSRRA